MGRDVTRYHVRDDVPVVSYGPTEIPDTWVLTVTTEDAGHVEIVVPEVPMHELWTEVKDTPWPSPDHITTERERLLRQLVHYANGADEEMLRAALEELGVPA